MVVPSDYPPFYFQTADGYRGASYEIAVELLHRLGYETSITQVSSLTSMLEDLGRGRYDLAPNLSATPARGKVAWFTRQAHVIESLDLIVRADSPITFDGRLESLQPYRIGIVAGWTYGPEFDGADHLDKAVVGVSSRQLKRLLSGSFDIAVNNAASFTHMAGRLGVLDGVRVLQPALYALPVNIGISRKMTGGEALAKALDKELTLFRQSPEYARILTTYRLPPMPAATSR